MVYVCSSDTSSTCTDGMSPSPKTSIFPSGPNNAYLFLFILAAVPAPPSNQLLIFTWRVRASVAGSALCSFDRSRRLALLREDLLEAPTQGLPISSALSVFQTMNAYTVNSAHEKLIYL
ncbi:hypothetical protein NX059_004686 [Plenodomus lindquistii]|nr:hypothetical protein NX059_004686 [Plenodomus lindquistii]